MSSNGKISEIIFKEENRFIYLQALRERGSFCDVTLVAGALEIKAHKVILAAISPYFKLMFTQEFKEQESDRIELKYINPVAVSSLVDFAYTGELKLDIHNAEHIYIGADYFGLAKLKKFCKEFLVESVEECNPCRVFELANLYNLTELAELSGKLIAESFLDFKFSHEFKSFLKDDFVLLIARPDLEIASEKDVFDVIVLWIKHDLENRCEYIYELLQQVRLTNLTIPYLNTVIAKYPPCQQSPECQQLIGDVVAYKSNPSRRGENGELKPRGHPEATIYIVGKSLINRNVFRTSFNVVDSFSEGQYHQVANMETEKFGQCAAVLNGKIYLVGGSDAHGHVNTVDVFTPGDAVTSSSPPMAFKRRFHSCCAHDGKLFVCGGKNGKSSKDCEFLDVARGMWQKTAEMGEARRSFAMVSCGNHLWALGGRDNNLQTLKSAEYYDVSVDEWKFSANMIQGRCFHSAVAYQDKIFVVGGSKTIGTIRNSAEMLDTITGQFSMIKSMRVQREMFAAAISGSKIYCFGGSDGKFGNLDSVESYDVFTGDWMDEGKVPPRKPGLGAVTIFEG